MDAKCPQCGSVYEISEEDIGVIATCESCGKEFEVKAVPSGARKIDMGKKAKPRLHGIESVKYSALLSAERNRNTESDNDVLFIAPTLCRILQYVGYVLSVVVFAGLGIKNLIEGFNHLEPLIGVLFFLACVVSMLLSLLIVRLWYEFSIAFFEAVRHLRQIRDKMEVRK